MATKANSAAPAATNVTRVIEVQEEIWAPTDKEEKGEFLSLDDQRGHIQLDLTTPLQLSDQSDVNHLIVRPPTARMINEFQSNRGSDAQRSVAFFGGCCLGIKPADVDNMNGRDWNRLARLVTHFIS